MAAVPDEAIDLDASLVARVREVVGADALRAFVEAAVRRDLDNVAFSRLLDELEAESGPVPKDVMAEAERAWRDS